MSASRSRRRDGCPICGQPAAEGHSPFCSKRCADIDLGRWLKGSYAIPTNDAPPEPKEPGEDAD